MILLVCKVELGEPRRCSTTTCADLFWVPMGLDLVLTCSVSPWFLTVNI